MSEGPPSPKRLRLENEEILKLSKDELVEKLREMDDYVSYLHTKQRGSVDKDDGDDKEGDDKSKQPNQDSSRRENTLVLRLTNKEQELQDCMNQITEMKATQTQNSAQLRSLFLDPAVNLVFQRMAKEMDDCKEKLKQTQNELSAWKFTADSQMGKRLMAKCRMLLQENEELGKMISSGRTSKLEAEIAVQKTLVTEMKTNQDEMNEFVSELEEDVEGMQSMIYVLQQQLKDTKESLAALEAENARLKTTQQNATAASVSASLIKQEPVVTVNSTSNSVSAADSSGGDGGGGGGSSGVDGGGGGGVCQTDGCDVDSPSHNNSSTDNSAAAAAEGVVTKGISSDAGKARTTDPSQQQTVSPKAETSQQASPGEGWRTSGKGDDIDGAAHHPQSNGKTTEEVEKEEEHDCSVPATETTELRTDQTCDKGGQSAPPPAKLSPPDTVTSDSSPLKADSRTDGTEVKPVVVTPEAKPIRNGGLEELTAEAAAATE